MNKKASIKIKIMMGLVPLVLIALTVSIITFSEKTFDAEATHWIEQSSKRKVDAAELKYRLLKLLSTPNKQEQFHNIRIIKNHIKNIDKFFKSKFESRSYVYSIFSADNVLSLDEKSKAMWNDNVKASLELALELSREDIDEELTSNIFNFLDDFGAQVDRESLVQHQNLESIKSVINSSVYVLDIFLLGIVVLIYLQGVTIGNRVKELTSNILNFEDKDSHDLPLISGNDELVELNQAYNQIMTSLHSTTISKNFFENVLGSMTDALVVINVDGRIIHFNQTMLKLFGYSEEEIKGKRFIEFIDFEDNTLATADLTTSDLYEELSWVKLGILNKTNVELVHNYELKIKNHQNIAIPCLLSGSILHEQNSSQSSYVIVLKDITQIKEFEEELEVERSKSVQAGKMATLGEMAGGVAHEINNPLATIDGLSKRIKIAMNKDPIPVDKIKLNIEKIEKHITRIAKIVSGLRSFARDGSKDPFERVNLSEILEDSLELCHERLKNKGIKLIGFDDFSKFPSIKGQQIPLTQVFVNLLNNAHDAILELDDKWIRLESKEEQDFLEISITDSGPGIPEEIRAKILQPFFTTKPVGIGTGLGLGIIVGILEKHGGAIKVDDNCPNTRFLITIPKNFNNNVTESFESRSA